MGDQSKDHRADELLDVVEPTGQHVARLPRSKVHAEALWHQVFHCLVVRSSLPARVLLQRRKRSSLAFPGMLDLSVSGHLVAGERPLDGIREVREEMGLVIDATRLVSLGRRLLVDDSGEGRNREIAHVFLLTDDTPLEDLRLEPNEVAGFVELTITDLLRRLEDPSSAIEADDVVAQVHRIADLVDVLAARALGADRAELDLGLFRVAGGGCHHRRLL